MIKRDFLSLLDFSSDELKYVIERAKTLRQQHERGEVSVRTHRPPPLHAGVALHPPLLEGTQREEIRHRIPLKESLNERGMRLV